jgi:hypothetical protein
MTYTLEGHHFRAFDSACTWLQDTAIGRCGKDCCQAGNPKKVTDTNSSLAPQRCVRQESSSLLAPVAPPCTENVRATAAAQHCIVGLKDLDKVDGTPDSCIAQML